MTIHGSKGPGGANNPARLPEIHAMAGTIFFAGRPIAFTEAEILRDVMSETFVGASRASDIQSMVIASRNEHALRNAIYNAGRWRMAAGWSNPADADKGMM